MAGGLQRHTHVRNRGGLAVRRFRGRAPAARRRHCVLSESPHWGPTRDAAPAASLRAPPAHCSSPQIIGPSHLPAVLEGPPSCLQLPQTRRSVLHQHNIVAWWVGGRRPQHNLLRLWHSGRDRKKSHRPSDIRGQHWQAPHANPRGVVGPPHGGGCVERDERMDGSRDREGRFCVWGRIEFYQVARG